MKTYLFDIRGGGETYRDQHGMQLSSLAEARRAAFQLLTDLSREDESEAGSNWNINICDENGNVQLKVSVTVLSVAGR